MVVVAEATAAVGTNAQHEVHVLVATGEDAAIDMSDDMATYSVATRVVGRHMGGSTEEVQ